MVQTADSEHFFVNTTMHIKYVLDTSPTHSNNVISTDGTVTAIKLLCSQNNNNITVQYSV